MLILILLLFTHSSGSVVCSPEVCLIVFFFPLENLNLLGNRYMEIHSVGIEMGWHGPTPKLVQRVG